MFTQEQIERIGGRVWTKGDRTVRVYLNDWARLIGLEVSRYGTGNIKSATLNGEPISNSRASKLINGNAKVWWEDGTIHITEHSELAGYAQQLVAAIAAMVRPVEVQAPVAEVQTEVDAVPLGMVRIQMPVTGWAMVDLDALPPVARALAEAISATSRRTIWLRSVAPERDLPGRTPEQLAFYGIDLDSYPTMPWDGWDTSPWACEYTTAELLRREARKLRGWYPVAEDGSDLPSSQAARTTMMAAAR